MTMEGSRVRGTQWDVRAASEGSSGSMEADSHQSNPAIRGRNRHSNLKPEACVWPLDVDEEAWFRGTHAFILAPPFPSYTGACVAS